MEKERRQFEILKALANDDVVAGQQLSDMLNVSLRTIYRDIEELLERGITIEGTRGADGGYRLHDRIGEVIRNSDCLQDVLKSIGVHKHRTPVNKKPGFETLSSSKVYVDRSFLVPSGKNWLVFETVCDALLSNHAIQISTTDADSSVVMPLGLVFSAGTWFLVSSDLSNTITSIPLQSVRNAKETALNFKAPRSFRAEDFVPAKGSDQAEFETVEFSLPCLSEYGAELVAGTAKYNSEKGTFEIGPISIEFAVRWLASLGPDVSVVRPKAVRKKLREYTESITQNNS